ncbi:MAG TPA: tetratricopeptide repeat protein [Vicinamibacterales bacterium]|nr:tetratricopeptide repeat protein [Vicinamibacterales bacterium]
MKFFRSVSALAMVLAIAAGASAQSRGTLRITGKVLNEAGQPVADAQVRAAKKGEAQPEVLTAKTNDKGEYTINGVAAGEWVIEAMKDGVGVKEVMAALAEGERTKTVDITIAKPAAPKPDPTVEINTEHQRAIALAQAGKIPEARKIYDDLLVKFPDVYQLHAMLANMYAVEGNAAKGLEHIKIALAKEPANVEYLVLSAEMMMEAGDKEGAQKVLESIDITKVKDARAFTNLAINHINGGKPAEAIDLLTKLIAQFPNDKALLYYRGRAYIVATKLPEAKADLEAFLAAAPTAQQAPDAKRLLEQLTKKL